MMAGAFPACRRSSRDAEHADLGEGDESVPRLDLGCSPRCVVHADQGVFRWWTSTS